MFTDNTMRLTEHRHFQIRNEIILLLGVDYEAVSMMRRTLEAVGFPVLIAEDDDQAADLFKSFNGAVRLLIIDVSLQDEGALETISALRKRNPALKVIVASKEVSPKELHEIQLVGVIELIRKPVDKEHLLRVVHRIVEK
jgi:DNA-binding NtrC family response regulator